MPDLSKIAKILGYSDEDGGPTAVEQAQRAIDAATAKTGSISKIASTLGIAEDDARQLIAFKVKGDEAAFQAFSRKLNLTEAMRSSGLMS